jgi:hypothetical protein
VHKQLQQMKQQEQPQKKQKRQVPLMLQQQPVPPFFKD